MTPDFIIQRVTDGDRDAVQTLLKQSGLPLAGLEDHWDTTLIVLEKGILVGTAALEIYEDGALLRSVAVDPAYRGLRLGHQLTEAALSLARENGVRSVFLLTETAGSFFPRFGFTPITRDEVPVGVRQSVEFTSVCPQSALVMSREL